MKKIVLLGVLCTLIVNAKISEKCAGCHGKKFEIPALGKSAIIKDMTKDEIIKSIYGYKKGTIDKYGLGAVMKGQVVSLSDKEIQEIADEIINKKKVNGSIKKLASCKSISKLTKDEIVNVINNGSHRYDCPMGAMPPEMATGKEVEKIATYLINGMQGKKPKSFNACTSCHGDDSTGMNGMSPDISHLGKVKNSIDTPIKKEIAKCVGKEGDASRLICYDDLAKSMGVDKPKISTTAKGKWEVSESTSPIDDSVTVVVKLYASDNILNAYGQFTIPTLILRCSENKTNAYVNWDMFLGMDSIKVLSRIDKQKAKTRSWYISTDNKAVFAPKNISFIKSLFGHDKLLQQLTPYGESPKITSFEIGGLKEAIKPLRKACGW